MSIDHGAFGVHGTGDTSGFGGLVRKTATPGSAQRPYGSYFDEIADELADVAIYLMELAGNLKIDLAKAIDQKMKKNAIKYPIEKSKGRHTKYDKL